MAKGQLIDIGISELDGTSGKIDYSKTEFDEWGELGLKEGALRRYFNGQIIIEASRFDAIDKLIDSRRAKLSIYILPNGKVIYGLAKQPEVIFSSNDKYTCRLDLQGVQ
jgi:hypothetical protein